MGIEEIHPLTIDVYRIIKARFYFDIFICVSNVS